MKVALVHDYLADFGGAERVLLSLSELYPEAPIYTAFYTKGLPAYERFKGRDIRASWAQRVPLFASKLHSPLRFLAPEIWESFDLDSYDVVISSASWYITKGVLTRPETLHICYCHTPPRYLYGYPTSVEWQRFWLVRQYARIVNHYLRKYDFLAAQRVDYFVANSRNVQERIRKFYRRESTIIYPPVEIPIIDPGIDIKIPGSGVYFLTGGRLTREKHYELAVQAANELDISLTVYGEGPFRSQLQALAGKTVEFVGNVDERELARLYAGAKAFIALAEDEDFGMTVVEAEMHGTPVIAYRGGGYLETIKEGVTGMFIDQLTVEALVKTIKNFQMTNFKFQTKAIKQHAQKFSKERFMKEMKEFVDWKWKEHCARVA